MSVLETNIFRITNVASLTTRYRLCRLTGLTPEQNEYFQNRQNLIKGLSYRMQRPVTIIERDKQPLLVIPDDAPVPPSEYALVRTMVRIQPLQDVFTLDYAQRSPENDAICLRFLRFLLQTPLKRNPQLWQPNSGRPFFEKKPLRNVDGIDHFGGFGARPLILPDGTIGLCVEPVVRYVRQQPLPAKPSRDDFAQKWKNRNFIYHYGDDWYEIRITGLATDPVGKCSFVDPDTKKRYTLWDVLRKRTDKPLAPEIANLSSDAAVAIYQNNTGHDRNAPTPLCYQVCGTHEIETRQHSQSLPSPEMRRAQTMEYAAKYLQALQFGEIVLQLDAKPVTVPQQIFAVPDLSFGKSKMLSVTGKAGMIPVSLETLGKKRLELLKDRTVGFYTTDPLLRQYFVLPQSVLDTFGPKFLAELKQEVDELFPYGSYEPIVIPYDDSGRRSIQGQGRAILQVLKDKKAMPGHAVVMLHSQASPRLRFRHEDELEAMVLRELKEQLQIYASVIHSAVGRRSYREHTRADGGREYIRDRQNTGRLAGYLRNVALTHVLLNNERWPFVLAMPLKADITIGIDVKANTCGLLAVGDNGSNIFSRFQTSKSKEKLTRKQMRQYLAQILQEEASLRPGQSIRSVVLHRDGRVWPSECHGAREAIERLKHEGILAQDTTLTIVEISKTSPARLRLFDTHLDANNKTIVKNPQVGTYYRISDTEAYLCTTGRAFPRPGTVNPLHIRLVEGEFPFLDCLEDLYALTTLAWTKPDDCSRYPITHRLNDRRLRAEAGQYDEGELDFDEDEEEDDDQEDET